MTLDEVIYQLESLKKNSLSFIDGCDDDIWRRDVKALDVAISFLEHRREKKVKKEKTFAGNFRCPTCNAAFLTGLERQVTAGIAVKGWIGVNEDLKADCHRYLDSLWQSKTERQSVYRWLSRKMRLPLKRCHISMMTTEQLYRARHILRQEVKKRRKKDGS
ncbi:MAG: hypothetical protein IJ736_15100 [Firmicutes bacterium]|nr:hypothetical protein [Bacillota bacterium]